MKQHVWVLAMAAQAAFAASPAITELQPRGAEAAMAGLESGDCEAWRLEERAMKQYVWVLAMAAQATLAASPVITELQPRGAEAAMAGLDGPAPIATPCDMRSAR